MLKGKSLQAVQAMEKTLELLELIAACKEKLNIGEIADKLCLNRREVMFLLLTLETREMVRWDGSARVYRPGRASLELARVFYTQQTALPLSSQSSTVRASVPLPSLRHSGRSGRRVAVGATA